MLSRCAVYDVVRWTPRMGRKGARRLCIHSDVFAMDRICDLKDYEREELLHRLPLRAKYPKEVMPNRVNPK